MTNNSVYITNIGPVGADPQDYTFTTVGLNGAAGLWNYATTTATSNPTVTINAGGTGPIGSSAGLIYNGGVSMPFTPKYGEQDVTIELQGKNPKIKCNDFDIDLEDLNVFMEMFKTLSDNQMALPFPDPAKLKHYEILRVQWQELMDLAKQYKVTEALLERPKKEEP